MDDLLRQCEREEKDLKMAIERERVLAGALDESIQGNPIPPNFLSSTPKRNMDTIGNLRPVEANERSASFASAKSLAKDYRRKIQRGSAKMAKIRARYSRHRSRRKHP
jgi:hypothetical protein